MPLAAGRGTYFLTVSGENLLLNGSIVKLKGLRCSNSLVSDDETAELIGNLDVFKSYGVNTVTVYVMGSRFGDIKGYQPDGSLNAVITARLARIIEATESRGMIVLVGCLYWSNSRAKEELGHWKQAEASQAIYNTVRWLKENRYTNVLVDPDNEGMACREKGWRIVELIEAGHSANPACLLANNVKGKPPEKADLNIHYGEKTPGKPYAETEGTPENVPYWGEYSKRDGLYDYLNIGVYTAEMKENQKEITRKTLERYQGYVLASTWLQAPPPSGPNMVPGGDGSPGNPGVRWWLEYLRDSLGGPWVPPAPRK